MLEENALFLEPPEFGIHNGSTEHRRAGVRHWPSRRPLGFASWRSVHSKWWGGCKTAIHVYETDDASHLLTIQPPRLFFRGWDVRDAIDRRVGVVYRSTLVEASGDLLTRIVADGKNGSARFLDWRQIEVGAYEHCGAEGTILHFGNATSGLPFARMLLLATVLVRFGD